MASTRTSWEIQTGPAARKTSAAASCVASSRARSRTRTLVSAARMLAPQVIGDPSLELSQGPTARFLLREQSRVNVLEGVLATLSNDHHLAAIVPFDDRTRGQT